MFRNRWPRSLTFQLWIRLSAAIIASSVLIYPVYLWVATEEAIAEAKEEARIRATVAGGGIASINRGADTPAGRPGNPKPPAPESVGDPGSTKGTVPPLDFEMLIESLGLLAIERLHEDGSVLESWGEVIGRHYEGVLSSGDLRIGQLPGYEATVGNGTYEPGSISALGVFTRDSFAMVFIMGRPQAGDLESPGTHRIVVDMSQLSDEAWTLFFRSLAFGAGLLIVALAALWILLRVFVARPMREYSQTARRIAEGSPERMPRVANNEIGELGIAINSMADALREQATTDSLTGLLNVRHFKETFPAMLEACGRAGQPLALANIDVDNLKPVNDTYGHAAGDLVLRAIGSCLRSWGGNEAVHWRVGGDEFVVALPGLDEDGAAHALRKLEEILAGHPVDIRGEVVELSVSAGLAIYPRDAESMADLVAIADERMYERKARAKGEAA